MSVFLTLTASRDVIIVVDMHSHVCVPDIHCI